MKLADFGFTDGINEIIAVTVNEDGSLNTAPIGVIVEDANGVKAKARIFPSHTRRNIERGSDFFANIVNDPVVFAISAFEDLSESYFSSLDPPILYSALAWCKFKPKIVGSIVELTLVTGEVFGSSLRAVNRGFSAVIEALVHATRYIISEGERKEELRRRIEYYYNLCQRCGSKREKEAFKIILNKVNLLF